MHARFVVQTIALSFVLSAAKCNPVGTSADVSGPWGGEHIALVVSDTGSTIEYDCANGTIAGPIRPGDDGRFETTGTHVRGHGGPMREGEAPDAHPASYSGHITGDKMTLTVREIDTGTIIGTFTLERGVDARVFKCL